MAIIVAECCQNHNGDFAILKSMVEMAAASGADYVKIQSINSNSLSYRERFELKKPRGYEGSITRPFAEEKERLSKLDLSFEQQAEFTRLCRKVGVKSMTTVFTHEDVERLANLGFDAIKVASYDCGSLPLIKRLAEHWNRIFISTGASTLEEIMATAELMNTLNDRIEFHLLHCTTIYPTPPELFNLGKMLGLRLFSENVGLSSHPDHSVLGVLGDLIAIYLGASCVERHYTILPANETKDGRVSMTPEDIRTINDFDNLSRAAQKNQLLDCFPQWQSFLGAMFDLSEEELANRDYYRGRFCSIKNGNPIYNWENYI